VCVFLYVYGERKYMRGLDACVGAWCVLVHMFLMIKYKVFGSI